MTDIVSVIMEEGESPANRGMWKLGKVLDTYPVSDGFVRGVTIEDALSNGKRKRLRRPLQKLFRDTGVANGQEPDCIP